MVRAIVGTLVEVGRGERSVQDFERAFRSLERSQAGPTAPAHGLCLLRVDYD
jgi:tRNA pseudouridine38-40 synthase